MPSPLLSIGVREALCASADAAPSDRPLQSPVPAIMSLNTLLRGRVALITGEREATTGRQGAGFPPRSLGLVHGLLAA